MEESREYTEHRPNNNSDVVQDQLVKENTEVLTNFSNEKTHSISGNQELGLTPECIAASGGQQDANFGIEKSMEEENTKLGFEEGKLSENNQIVFKLAGNDQTEADNLLSSNKDTENLLLPTEIATTPPINECLEVPSEDANKNSIAQMNPPVEDLTLNSSIEKSETFPTKKVDNSRHLGHRDKKILRSKKKSNKLRSPISTDRVLRSRIQEKAKAPEPSPNSNNLSSGGESKRKKKKKKKKNVKGNEGRTDECSVIKKRLKYLVHRMKYEQNLIEAYSSEGWKGFSSDKLKPEKELQRASSEIMRQKLKIRDLFQHLDSLCAKGRLSESLFDSEGQIDSEDIFCAQCGSKEPSIENDIILCDGACDRGFHQFCLEPPLLNTDIPPDDEGWLCPGCDCKDDCIDIINEFQGTNLSITDSWEKVYPEAAAAAAGQSSVHALGLPSDDSEDDDYDPNAPDTVRQEDESSPDKSDESSSDETGYASAPNELEAPPNDDQFVGLSSDDSEDGNYDPDAPELDLDVNPESSGSDFTSDSEDLTALNDNYSSKGDCSSFQKKNRSDCPIPSSSKSTKSLKSSEGQSSQRGPTKGALDKGPDKDGPDPVSGRRQVDRLDYKRLHDEQYGSVASDSSDESYRSVSVDSNHDRGRGSSSRKRSSQKLVPGSLNNGSNNLNSIEAEHSSKKRARQKPAAEDVNNSVSKKPEDSQKSSSTGRRTTSSPHRLGQPVLERLFASFKENQYPKLATKESLAQELGLSLKRVSKWFENTRWSTRHPSSAEPKTAKSASRKANNLSQTTRKRPKLKPESGTKAKDTDKNGVQDKESPNGDKSDRKLATQKTTSRESPATNSKKRKGRSDQVASRPKDKKETQKPPAKSPKVKETNAGVKARRKKSI